MKRAVNHLSFVLIATLLSGPAFGGRVVVFTDEWFTSNTGFTNDSPNSTTFTDNLVNLFGTGSYLVYSNVVPGLTESSFTNRLTTDGVTVTQTVASGQILTGFKAVLLAGPITGGVAPNAAALIAYVNGGGNVFLEAGTGGFAGGAAGESAAWAPFLGTFGITLATTYNTGNPCQNYAITSANPLFSGVTQLYECGGQQTTASGSASVIATNATVPVSVLAVVSSVPEPGTLSLLMAGVFLLTGRVAVRKFRPTR